MGLRSALRLVEAAKAAPALEASLVDATTRTGIRSPWASGILTPVVYKDIYGAGADAPLDRAAALSIPAVAKGVALVSSALSGCPLRTYEGSAEVPSAPWLYETTGPVAPQYRMQFTAEDLVLIGWCVWLVERDSSGEIVAADRLRPDQWQFDGLGNVQVGDELLDPSRYILIKGPQDGILTTGARTLRGAIDIERAWIRAVKNPNPTILIKQTSDDVLDDDEIDDLLDDWRVARQDPDGTVAFVPSGVEIEAVGQIVPETLVEARNAVAVDVARLIGLPASALDAGAVQTSLTYNNTNIGLGLVLVQQGFQPYANAIGYALSMDTVCPPGQRIALDMTELLADAATISRSGAPTED